MIYNDNRPERIRGTVYLSVLLLFVGYQSINVFVPNADMILATRVMAAGFYSSVLYVYGRDAYRAFVKPNPTRSDFLIVGIWLSFLSHLFQTLYSIVYRLAFAPNWLLNAEVVAPIVLLSVVAAVLHVSAPGSLDGIVPRRNRMALGAGIGVAVLLVGIMLITRPNLAPFIEQARPYIADWWRTGALPAPPPGVHG